MWYRFHTFIVHSITAHTSATTCGQTKAFPACTAVLVIWLFSVLTKTIHSFWQVAQPLWRHDDWYAQSILPGDIK